MRWRPFHCRALVWLTLLGVPLTGAPQGVEVAPQGDARRLEVRLDPAPYAALARHLAEADEGRRREFADLTLATLLDAFRRELEVASQEQNGTAGQRAKLASWRRGTAAMIGRLEAVRRELAAGGALAVHVDHRYRVMLLVNGQPVVVTGPRVEVEPEIERRVVERFCALFDCRALAAPWHEGKPAQEDESVPAWGTTGLWVLEEATRPSYEIGTFLRCQFGSFANRDGKEAACQRLAEELARLASALRQAGAQGYRIDWRFLAHFALAREADGRVMLNAEGIFVRVPLPLLARAQPTDWQRVVDWLRLGGIEADRRLLIEGADLLLQ